MTGSLSVLIVEDEPLIAMMLEDYIEGLGHRVAGAVETVEDALAQVEAGEFDVVILDVHLRGGAPSWPVADALADRGVKFLVATGGHVEPPPERHVNAPILSKPFTVESVKSALEAATGAG
jgi:CheY-like chemotaxis protein